MLALLLQCAGDIEMNRRAVSTPTPTNCLRSNCTVTTVAVLTVYGPNGSCLFEAGLPTDIVGGQNFQTLSTRQTPHLGD